MSPFIIMLIMNNRGSNSTPLCCERTAKTNTFPWKTAEAAAFLVIHRIALTPQGLSELVFPFSMSNMSYILQAPHFERCGGNRQENTAASPRKLLLFSHTTVPADHRSVHMQPLGDPRHGSVSCVPAGCHAGDPRVYTVSRSSMAVLGSI